jgi:hypothetical protein
MTLLNFTKEELQHLRAAAIKDPMIKYIVWIREVGEEGTPHHQIYAQS